MLYLELEPLPAAAARQDALQDAVAALRAAVPDAELRCASLAGSTLPELEQSQLRWAERRLAEALLGRTRWKQEPP